VAWENKVIIMCKLQFMKRLLGVSKKIKKPRKPEKIIEKTEL
jgi:hypothetical protein